MLSIYLKSLFCACWYIHYAKISHSTIRRYHMIAHAYVRYKFDNCTYPYLPRVQHEVPTARLFIPPTPKIFVGLKEEKISCTQDIIRHKF